MAYADYEFGMDYGVGVDELAGEVRGDALESTEPTRIEGAEGQTVGFSLDRIETSEELQQALGMKVDAKASFGLWGGSAKFEFMDKSSLNSYSLYLLVSVNVMNSFRQIRGARLKASAASLLSSSGADRFREMYGDTYLRGILTGGEYFALLEITTRDSSEQQKLAAEMDAGYVGRFNVSAALNRSIEKIAAHRNIRIRSFQRGGDETSVPQTADEIIQRSAEFAEQVAAQKAVPYTVLLSDYRTVELPSGVSLVDIENSREVLRSLGALRSSLVTLVNDVDYVLLNQDQFPGLDVGLLHAQRNEVREALNIVLKAASLTARDPAASELPELRIPVVTLPVRRVGQAASSSEEALPPKRRPKKPPVDWTRIKWNRKTLASMARKLATPGLKPPAQVKLDSLRP